MPRRKKPDGYINSNVWFEFHQIPDVKDAEVKLPSVTSQDFPFTLHCCKELIIPKSGCSYYTFRLEFYDDSGDHVDVDGGHVCVNFFRDNQRVKECFNTILYGVDRKHKLETLKIGNTGKAYPMLDNVSQGVYAGQIYMHKYLPSGRFYFDIMWIKSGKFFKETKPGGVMIK
ncbi:MAG: hypothetical protein DRP09_10295 [Candidatus Thorarchaeota archaeon]|nr:MAG: hypothetical protein DRP09_10295 [Candidatus Thorarchaeota archaeon]